MQLALDSEYLEAIKPYMPVLSQAPKLEVGDIASRRAGVDGLFDMLMKAWPTMKDVERTTQHITARDGFEIPIHTFRKKGTSSSRGPAVFYVHGGGYFSLSTEHYRKVLEVYVSKSGIPIISVDYRLAPEHPFPTPLDDAYSALLWLNQNAGQLSIDPARVAILGDSAGGGLAASIAIKARDEGLSPRLAKQMLIGSMLDDRTTAVQFPAIDPFATWATDDNITGWRAYLGSAESVNGEEGTVSQYAAPSRVASVKNLPSTYLEVPDVDIFRDENITYARRLAAENIDTEIHVWSGVPHSFELFSPNISTSQIAIQCRVRAMQRL